MGQMNIFLVLATLITAFSIGVITAKNPVTSAINLIGTLFALAGVYATIGADFIAAIQVIVYAGAIMVLFMFVIMLLNVSPEDLREPKLPMGEWAVLLVTVIAFVVLGWHLLQSGAAGLPHESTPEAIENAGGNTYLVGMALFTKYLWPFELASIVIMLAVIASIVIAKKDHAKDPKLAAQKPGRTE